MYVLHVCRYAPSLRQLRQYALLLYFPPTVTARLASRLKQVSEMLRWVGERVTRYAIVHIYFAVDAYTTSFMYVYMYM